MRIAVMGTGPVGQALAGKLAELGHEVAVGTRDPEETLARTEPDYMGNPPFKAWLEARPGVALATPEEAAAEAELIVNATNGAGSLAMLEAAGAENLAGKVLVDIANPLDYSQGMPPSLFVSNTDSLGEQIQRAFPDAKMVKALNTMNCEVMVDPSKVPGEHDVFLCGEDADAKRQVGELLQSFGWPAERIRDLGGISSARGSVVRHLDELLTRASVPPAVNQIELSPFLHRTREDTLRRCAEAGIAVEAYSPLTRGRRLDDSTVKAVASEVERTPAQVLIRWSLQKGFVVGFGVPRMPRASPRTAPSSTSRSMTSRWHGSTRLTMA